MYGISIPVTVKSIEPCNRILIEWPGHGGPTTVEWIFPRPARMARRSSASRMPVLLATGTNS